MKMDNQKPVKQNGKKIVKSKISDQLNQQFETKSSKLSKLQKIIKRKKIIKRENMLHSFKKSKVSLLI